MTWITLGGIFIGTTLAATSVLAQTATVPNPTGKFLTPLGVQAKVGSFPVNMVMSPDGKYIAVSDLGLRTDLSVLRTDDLSIAHRLRFIPDVDGLYFGMAFGAKGWISTDFYYSHGSQDKVTPGTFFLDGLILPGLRSYDVPRYRAPSPEAAFSQCVSAIALSSDQRRLYAVNNMTYKSTKPNDPTDLKGIVTVFDIASKRVTRQMFVDGFPFDIAVRAPIANQAEKVYVTSERDNVVDVLNPATGTVTKRIAVGRHPLTLTLDSVRDRLYVVNANSDTVSVIDAKTDTVLRTLKLRPAVAANVPGCTPTDVAVSPDGTRLYVSLADMNCVAVLSLPTGTVQGYIPTGWYPTSVLVSRDGQTLFVANAKGVVPQTPNPGYSYSPERRPLSYILNLLEGTVSRIPVPTSTALAGMTTQVIKNNRLADPTPVFTRPPVKHVIYIIKENRSYDQVMSDIPRGRRDTSSLLFGQQYTPNQHQLQTRFAQFDYFFCNAEVSAQGWSWCVAGMTNPYNEYTTTYSYVHSVIDDFKLYPTRNYDAEGLNNFYPVDRVGLNDVSRPASPYLWDAALSRNVSVRLYGIYETGLGNAFGTVTAPSFGFGDNQPARQSALNLTDTNFRRFDLSYRDSDAWWRYGVTFPKQLQVFGANNARSRFEEWNIDFRRLIATNSVPNLMIVRFPCDHTVGTAKGYASVFSMVADNDYAVGQLVEAVSKSPIWLSTAIFVVEDDAQFGGDSVDAHRSFAQVISPYTRPGILVTKFHNSTSVLKTIELILGLPSLSQFTQIAAPMDVFTTLPVNSQPYTAIMPARSIIADVNDGRGYRALDSEQFNLYDEESEPDLEVNDIMYGEARRRNGGPR